nr:hypothetical protein [Tanacetum cinerariifolium]
DRAVVGAVCRTDSGDHPDRCDVARAERAHQPVAAGVRAGQRGIARHADICRTRCARPNETVVARYGVAKARRRLRSVAGGRRDRQR